MNNKLTAKVAARNRVAAYVKEVAPQILAALTPFVGQKVELATGELSAKAKKALEPFLGNKDKIQIYRGSSNYSLYFVFKTSESLPEYSCIYDEVSFYVGDLSGGILTKINEFKPENYKSDWNAAEIAQTLAAAEAKRKEAQNLESSVYPFVDIR